MMRSAVFSLALLLASAWRLFIEAFEISEVKDPFSSARVCYCEVGYLVDFLEIKKNCRSIVGVLPR